MYNLKSKRDISNELSVSVATIDNWIKTDLIAQPSNGSLFNESEYNKILSSIKNSDSKLRGRANRSRIDKSFITYLGITDSRVKELINSAVSIHRDNNLKIGETIFALSYNILKNNNLITDDCLTNPKTKLDFFINSWNMRIKNSKVISLYSPLNIFDFENDFLGAFYQSIQSLSTKSKLGSFYTPSELLFDIGIEKDKRVLDPCCGSGNILMNVLSKEHLPENVFGFDIDETAIKICKVNLALYFKDVDMKSNIEKRDLIFEKKNSSEKYDFIITNPPWGSKYKRDDKEYLIKAHSDISTSESFSISLYNSFKKLAHDGELIFFLPYSFLNVAAHRKIREYVINQKKEIRIYLLGNAFKGVMSESIRVHINNNIVSDKIEIVSKSKNSSAIFFDKIESPYFIIAATSLNNEQKIVNKTYKHKHFTLKGKCDFGLGIVTGNNKNHITTYFDETKEPIFRGRDILPFKYSKPHCFIKLSPNQYQQTAPIGYYRQKKVVYRFISDRIVCALDNENHLILNSANLFIPRVDYPFETIMCLFNSKLYSYIYRKKFHSKKVLRFHLESLPIPVFNDDVHKLFYDIYCGMIDSSLSIDVLDILVYKVFKLSKKEISVIEKEFNKKCKKEFSII